MMVSICMITYNHETYLKQAIEGVLNQKTNFDFELIIANDNSPDNTSKIVLEVIKNHDKGNCIRFIDNKINIGMMPNFTNALKNCTGKYVALCEGDDYWTNENKLQKQVDFLEENKDYVISFHKAMIETNGEIIEDTITHIQNETTTINDLSQGNYIHTCTVLYKNNLFENFPDYFYTSPIGDYFLHMLNSQYGKIHYMNTAMAVYRVHATSYWSSKEQSERTEIWIQFIENIQEFFSADISKNLRAQIEVYKPKKRSFTKKIRDKIKKKLNIFHKK